VKKTILALPLAMVALLLMASPQSALAHETHIYKIGNQAYQFTVGSLNEPITVDDKTGVDLSVIKAPIPGEHEEEADHHKTAGAVEGLDKTLKVEVIAGDKKKVFELVPVHGQPGAYKTTFYPTIQTTLAYRFFGTLNNVPIDLTFTCNPAGHPISEEDKTQVKISDKVTRLLKKGAFGCPVAKADMGFPEQSASVYDLANKDASLERAVAKAQADAQSSRSLGIIGIVVGILGFLAGAGAWMKGRKV